MVYPLKTTRPGYFLLTIPHNSKSQNQKMQYGIITTTYVNLDMEEIQEYKQMVEMAGQIQVSVMNYQQERQQVNMLGSIWQGHVTSK